MALRFLTWLLLVAICQAEDLSLRGGAMGTLWSVKARASEVSDPVSLRRAIVDRLEGLERSMSTWRDDSEISRFNALTSTNWFRVSPEFVYVVRRSLEIAEATEGAFDPTVAPLVRLWGFTSLSRKVDLPELHEIEETLQRIGFGKVDVDEVASALRKRHPRLELDLSAIAKGYAVDAVGDLMIRSGVTNWLVDIGGEVRGSGLSGKGRSWRVGVEEPRVGESRINAVVELSAGALATSGDYRNFVLIDGLRHAHIINPVTGRPIRQRGLAVSVKARDCLTADAWATALCVLGPDRGLSVADALDVAALFLVLDQGKVGTFKSLRW